MTKEDLNYIKDTLDWIHENTDLKNHEEGIETYSNLMMNCENVITDELALFSVSKRYIVGYTFGEGYPSIYETEPIKAKDADEAKQLVKKVKPDCTILFTNAC